MSEVKHFQIKIPLMIVEKDGDKEVRSANTLGRIDVYAEDTAQAMKIFNEWMSFIVAEYGLQENLAEIRRDIHSLERRVPSDDYC